MKVLNKIFTTILTLALVVGLTGPISAFAASTPTLGWSSTYGILASTYTNTSAVTVNGDVGFTTGPAVPPAGTHPNYGPGAPYALAGTDQGTALTALSIQPCTFSFAPGAIDLSTDITHGTAGIFTPGVYCSTGAMDISGPLSLSGSGTYIFRAVGAINSAVGAVITLNGASSCDVFWTATQAMTLGANTSFVGTAIDDAGITVGANTTWLGRALAFGGTVTTDTNTITVPICTAPATLKIIKQVINDNGGIKTAANFNLHVKLSNIDVVGSPAIGLISPGRSYSLSSGVYTISEDINTGYAQSFSGDCSTNGGITLFAGDDKTCIITNNDIAPTSTINVVKIVINDNGGNKVVSDFPLFVNNVPVTSGITNNFAAPAAYTITETQSSNYTQSFSGDCDASGHINLLAGESKVCIITNNDIQPSSGGGGGSSTPSPLIDVIKIPNPLALPLGPGIVNYTYTLHNIGTVPVINISMVGDSCIPITLISGDINNDKILDLKETWVYQCSTMLHTTHTNTVVATGWANGISATDIASATVVVGSISYPLITTSTVTLIVPPLIHVTKIPSPLKLSANGGVVTYTEKISNPGKVTLDNIHLSDDKCSPMKYISGDINKNLKLETNETWTYTCSTRLTKTTTNTAVVTGTANNLTARDFALATVIVTPIVPKLPNTGLPPEQITISWNALIFTSIFTLASTSLFFILKKRAS